MSLTNMTVEEIILMTEVVRLVLENSVKTYSEGERESTIKEEYNAWFADIKNTLFKDAGKSNEDGMVTVNDLTEIISKLYNYIDYTIEYYSADDAGHDSELVKVFSSLPRLDQYTSLQDEDSDNNHSNDNGMIH